MASTSAFRIETALARLVTRTRAEEHVFGTVTEPDHRVQLRESVADFVARAVDSKGVRASIASDAGFSADRWRAMAELGWTYLALSEESGGLGLEHADLVALHQEVGRAALPEPLAIIPLLVGRIIAENDALAPEILPKLLSGELLATLGWQGRMGAMGADDVGPTATPTGAGWMLFGEARFVPLAGSATAMIVAARLHEGVALFWLPDMPAPVDVMRLADGSVQGTVALGDIIVGPEAVIAGPEFGGAILEKALDMARLAVSGELIGIMERALEMTLEHLRQREQFGKPIGSFQALQHRAVDLYIQIELSRSAVLRAAEQFDSAQVSAAKSRCGEAAHKVLRECIQMHGAIGYTAEYDLSLYVNRGLQLSAWLGNPRDHRSRYADLNLKGGGHDA